MREMSTQRWKTGRARSQSGFTITEILVGIVLLGLIGVAVASVSMTGLLQVSDDNVERQADASTAQFASVVFAADVQGAAGLRDECAGSEGGVHLVTLKSSDASAPDIEYRRTDSAPYDLQRVECRKNGDLAESTVARNLADPAESSDPADPPVPPEVRCGPEDAPVECDDPTKSPRVVTLQVSRTESFAFELDGARRTTDGNTPGGSSEAPTFLALDGLTVAGSAKLKIVGDAYINHPPGGGSAIVINGSKGTAGDPASYPVWVDGTFALQQEQVVPCGATCYEKVWSDERDTFDRPRRDPYWYLKAPDASDEQDSCERAEVDGQPEGPRICKPGIYTETFPPDPVSDPGNNGGGVRDYWLEPGVYVLRKGLSMNSNNGSLKGEGVLFYIESGSVSLTGGEFELGPPAEGDYEGILFFQSRDFVPPQNNTNDIVVGGNSQLQVLAGTIYAPASGGVALGSGTGSLSAGQVIGTRLSVGGTGNVSVGGF